MKKAFIQLILICISLTTLNLTAQHQHAEHPGHACGVEPDAKTIKYLNKTRAERQAFELQRSSSQNITWIPVQIHFVAQDNGNGVMDDYTTDRLMGEVNLDFRGANVQFYECSPRNQINSTSLHLFDYQQDDATLTNTHDVANVLNIYFVGGITNGSANWCGYAFFPGGPDHLVVGNFCAATGTTLVHELGHSFTLYHTHGKSNTVPTDELVDGSNCAIAGDDVCDTPAEPILLGKVNSNCDYTGNDLDNNGHPFDPAVNNYMSYAPTACRQLFTPGQYARIAYSAQYDRPYLSCATSHPCENAISSFPYNEGFENGLGDWEQNQAEQFDFDLGSGSTPTPNTGPAAAHGGSQYIFTESSSPIQAGMIGVLNSPCFDFSSLTMGQLKFWYHMNGANTGQLIMQASTDNGYTWGMPNFIFNESGDQGNQWQEAVIDLSPWAGEQFFRFRFGVVIGSETSDIAIDDVSIVATTPCAGFSMTTSATNVTCFGDQNGSASATATGGTAPYSYVWSTGATTSSVSGLAQGTYTVDVADDNGCMLTNSVTINEPLKMSVELAATNTSGSGNANGSITFANIAGAALPVSYQWSTGGTGQQIFNLDNGNYTLTVTDANGCVASNRIFLSDPVACTSTKSNWPHQNSWEGGTALFKQNTDDDRFWKKRSGSTPTNNTGPSGAYDNTYYRYVEASGSANGPNKTSVLTTKKCLNFSALNQPTFTFWYHMYGNTMGSLDVQISLDGGNTWRGSVWTREGDQGNSWQKAVVDLSLYPSNQKRVRIVGTTGSGVRSDIAIDLYRFVDASQADEIADDFMSSNAGLKNISTEPKSAVDFDILKVFPNPATDLIQMNIETPLEENSTIDIFDAMGRKVLSNDFISERGEQQISIDISKLENGIYHLKMSLGDGVQTKTFVVAK